MTIETMLAMIGLPAIGWGWNVERRLTKLETIKETAEHTRDQVDKIVDHLIKEK